MRYRYRDLIFTWQGGEYIEVHYQGKAFEVINVFNYAEGEPHITTREEMIAECKEFYADCWLPERDNYIENLPYM